MTYLLIGWIISALLSGEGYTMKHHEPVGGYLDAPHTITLVYSQKLTELPATETISLIDEDNQPLTIIHLMQGDSEYEVKVQVSDTLQVKKEYYLLKSQQKQRLIRRWIYASPELYDLHTPLGALYSPTETIFRLFAPRANEVQVRLYARATDDYPSLVLDMEPLQGGIWEAHVAGDLNGLYYTYVVSNPHASPIEIVDPYAHLTTRGDDTTLEPVDSSFTRWKARGIIIDMKQSGAVSPYQGAPLGKQDAIIYEIHTRDVSIDPESGILTIHRGLFDGLSEPLSIGRLKALGINVVQLLPVNEFVQRDEEQTKGVFLSFGPDSDGWYRWGYMPIHYFSPEGWFAPSKHPRQKVTALKKLISTLHENGIKVVLDVVLNHTAEGSATKGTYYGFRAIDPDYYYRTQPDGSFYDGISVGNELFSEMPMVRRFIKDVLSYWVTQYDVDGFRMDWMSATDPQTLAELAQHLQQLKPDILFYGELWPLRGQTYQKGGKGYLDRQHVGLFEKDFNLPAGSIAGFNDYFRDAIKGSGFQRDYAGGYIQDRTDEKYFGHLPYELIPNLITGMTLYHSPGYAPDEWAELRSPLNVINYVAVHDGYTLWDKLIIAEYMGYRPPGEIKPHYPYSKDNPQVVDFNSAEDFPQGNPEERLMRYNRFAAALLLTSQGIPLLHGGQEMLRQKIDYHYHLPNDSTFYYFFQHNSYNRPDAVNALRWQQRERYQDLFRYYQGLIALRRAHPTFRRTTTESIRIGLQFHPEWVPEGYMRAYAYELLDATYDDIRDPWKRVAVLINPYHTPLTFRLGEGTWYIVVDDTRAGTEVLGTAIHQVDVQPSSLMVLYQPR